MKAIFCGGRDYSMHDRVRAMMVDLQAQGLRTVIHGAALGADSIAAYWADKLGIAVEPYPADWKKHGKAAGPIRNQQMLDEGKPDLVVAFKGGNGTKDMMRRARKAGVPVVDVDSWESEP